MSLDLLITLDCPGCEDEREFAQPPCTDGHRSACPEVVCVVCGAAMFLAAIAVVAPDGRARRELRGAA